MIKRMNRTRLRPLIGVSACLKETGRGGWNHAVGDKYVQAAIRAVGGLPVVIPAASSISVQPSVVSARPLAAGAAIGASTFPRSIASTFASRRT